MCCILYTKWYNYSSFFLEKTQQAYVVEGATLNHLCFSKKTKIIKDTALDAIAYQAFTFTYSHSEFWLKFYNFQIQVSHCRKYID